MTPWLTLSIFPGVGQLDRAFEDEGFCIVRGPDLLWGGDVRRFNPPAGVFDGVIGGDPCQAHSVLRRLVEANGHQSRYPDMTPEYERIIREAQPRWFLRENVPQAPDPVIDGYIVTRLKLHNRWLGEVAERKRAFWFGTRDGRRLDVSPNLVCLEAGDFMPADHSGHDYQFLYRSKYAVISGGGGTPSMRDRGIKTTRIPVPDMAELMGLPRDFLADAPFTQDEKRRVIANGVPLPMGRAIAGAVRRALCEQAE